MREQRRVFSPQGIEPLGPSVLGHIDSLLPEGGRGPIPERGGCLSGTGFGDRPVDRDSGAAREPEGDAALLAAASVTHACRAPLETIGVHTAAERLGALESREEVERMLSVVRDERPDTARLAALARWLCTFGTSSQMVDAALAILGVTGTPRDRELVIRLGLVDELTTSAMRALRNLLPDPEPAMLDLARQVEDWGRIYAVNALSGSTLPALRDWLLRGGYENGIAYEETAFVTVTTGGLAAALQGEVDDELLDHAGHLLATLTEGILHEDMSDYRNGELAMELYLGEMLEREVTIGRLSAVSALATYLGRWSADNPHLTADSRERLLTLALRVIARAEWRPLVRLGLASSDLGEASQAIAVAQAVGIDGIVVARGLLPRHPLDGYLWQTVLETADRDEMESLLALGDRLLHFDTLPQGPANDYGPAGEAVDGLDRILWELKRFPGLGWGAIRVGLRSRYLRPRVTALAAFAGWPRSDWPDDAADLLRALAPLEPDRKLRRRMRALLQR
jgi:hypothetical protein